MNRPFYAFGLLIAFLAPAMLVIGLSSRPAAERSSAGGSGLPRRQPGVTLYVAVLPEAVEDWLEQWADGGEIASPTLCGFGQARTTYALGGDFDVARGEVDSIPSWRLVGSLAYANRRVGDLTPAKVEPAILVPLNESNSLTTGYDAAYDKAMSAPEMPRTNKSESPAVQLDPIDADPMMGIFDSLVRSKTLQVGPKSYLGGIRARRWDFEVRAYLSGARNRLWQLLVFAGVADEWTRAAEQTGLIDTARASTRSRPTWAEYIAWIGSKRWTVARRDGSITNSVAFWSQPDDQLLQFAVAGLNRVAELLHELIGQWMDRAADRLAQRASPASATSPK